MVNALSFKWFKGFIRIELLSDGLVVRALKSSIMLEPRVIQTINLDYHLREFKSKRDKVIYLDLKSKLTGESRSARVMAYSSDHDTYLGPYWLVYTLIGDLPYLTIYSQPGALYDYVILSIDKIMVKTNSRREVYILDENGSRKLMLL
ncbi:MAG: hypothetical protein QXR02_02120 [Acidilobaceae archaeon]